MADWRTGDSRRGSSGAAQRTERRPARDPYPPGSRYTDPPRKPGPTPLTRRGRILMWTAAVASALVVLVSLGAYAIYAKLDGNLSVTNAFGGLQIGRAHV